MNGKNKGGIVDESLPVGFMNTWRFVEQVQWGETNFENYIIDGSGTAYVSDGLVNMTFKNVAFTNVVFLNGMFINCQLENVKLVNCVSVWKNQHGYYHTPMVDQVMYDVKVTSTDKEKREILNG